MTLEEHRVEPMVFRWLKNKGYACKKGDNVDIEAYGSGRLERVVEAKGDQFHKSGVQKGRVNDGALRNAFFMGLGQILMAHTRHSESKISLAVTGMYSALIRKYADVLRRVNASVIWVSRDRIYEDDLSSIKRRDNSHSPKQDSRVGWRGQGHPDGEFRCGVAQFKVRDGKLVDVEIAGKQRRHIKKYSELCECLKIHVGGDSAARALRRKSRKN